MKTLFMKLSSMLLSLCVTEAFPLTAVRSSFSSPRRSSRLSAKRSSGNSKKKTAPKVASGFGGAATEKCACGSELSYNKCCGRFHSNPDLVEKATPTEIVRARYTAYAKNLVDFIVRTTHPEHESFQQDMAHWKETIESGFLNYELLGCEILKEEIVPIQNLASVKFRANMLQKDNEQRMDFIETSLFQREEAAAGKTWLYRQGKVEKPPDLERKIDSSKYF